jgi:hypothetical protein
MATKILYIHGFGGKGGTGKTLEKLLGTEFMVERPKFFENELSSAQAFKDELDSAKRHADEIKPDLIIGSSLGGFVASFLSGYKRILVNPCFSPSKITHIFPYTIMDSELQKIRELEDTIPEDKNDVFGLFGNEDELFGPATSKLFLATFKQKFDPLRFYTMPGGHKISTDNIKTKLIPLIYDMIMDSPG